MEKTTVVNIYFSSYDIYIGRKGKGQDGYFGNPFVLTPQEARGATIERFKEYFYTRLAKDPEFKRCVHELRGKVLGCFCKPGPCHGDIIADYVNSIFEKTLLGDH